MRPGSRPVGCCWRRCRLAPVLFHPYAIDAMFRRRYGHKRKKHHARLLRNTDLEYVRVCGVRPSSSLPKKESLCEGRTAAARKCALVARDCYETPLRPRSQVCASSEPCECLDVLEKRLTGFFTRRRQSGGRPRRRRSSRMGRGEEAL